jgi:WD40 repeat protein
MAPPADEDEDVVVVVDAPEGSTGAIEAAKESLPTDVAGAAEGLLCLLHVPDKSEGTQEMEEASRERVQRELREKEASLTERMAALLEEARALGAMRTRSDHDRCRSLVDQALKRQLGERLPRAKQPPSSLYSRFKHLLTVNGHATYPAYCVKLDQTGEYAVTGADDTLVKVWALRSGRLVHSLRGHVGVITDLAISPDNSMVASSSEDKAVRVWSLRDGVPLAVLLGHVDSVNYVSFHPVLNRLFSGSDDGTVKAWNLDGVAPTNHLALPLSPVPPPVTFQHRRDRAEHSARVKCVSICPLGRYFATGSDDAVGRIWSMGDIEGKVLEAAGGEVAEAGAALKSTGCEDMDVCVESESGPSTAVPEAGPSQPPPQPDAHGPSPLLRLMGHRAYVSDILYSNLGDRLLTASMMDGTVRVWGWTVDGQGEGGLVLTTESPIIIQVHEGDLAAIGAQVAAGQQRHRKPKEDDNVRISVPALDNVVWTSDDKFIVTAQSTRPRGENASTDLSWNQMLKVWNSRTGHLVNSIAGHGKQSCVLLAHPSDPRIILSAGYDGRVCLWDITTCAMLRQPFDNLLLDGPETEDYTLGAHVPLVDGQFATNGGLRVVLSDAAGRLNLFGMEDPRRYAKVECEQFFEGDYENLIHDTLGNALDETHQVAPHLIANRLLCQLNGRAYEPQPVYQRLGPKPLPAAEMEARSLTIRDKARQVFELLRPEAGKGPAEMNLRGRDFGATIYTIEDLDNSPPRNGKGPRSRARASNRTRDNRSLQNSMADYYPQYRSDDDDEFADHSYETRHSTATRQQGRLSASQQRAQMEARREQMAREREERHRRREMDRNRRLGGGERGSRHARSRRPTRRSGRARGYDSESDEWEPDVWEDDDEENDEDFYDLADEGESEQEHEQRERERRDRKRKRRTHTADDEELLPYMADPNNPEYVEFDSTVRAVFPVPSLGADGQPVPAPPLGPGEEDRTTLTCALCGLGHSEEFPLPGPELGEHPIVHRDRRFWVHDDCAKFSPQVIKAQTGYWSNIVREINRGRQLKCSRCNRPGATIGCLVTKCKKNYHYLCAVETDWDFYTRSEGYKCRPCRGLHDTDPPPPSKSGHRAKRARKTPTATTTTSARRAKHVPVIQEKPPAPEGDIKREWLSGDKPDLFRYVPQQGDVVVYLPAAHEAHLSNFQNGDPLPLSSFTGDWGVVRLIDAMGESSNDASLRLYLFHACDRCSAGSPP